MLGLTVTRLMTTQHIGSLNAHNGAGAVVAHVTFDTRVERSEQLAVYRLRNKVVEFIGNSYETTFEREEAE